MSQDSSLAVRHADISAAEGWFPLSPYQRDIWLGQQLNPESPQYNLCGYFRVTGAIDIERLLSAARKVLAHFDALRLQLCEVSGLPLQRLKSDCDCDPQLIDFSAERDPRRACLAWVEQSFARPFPFDGGPLYELAVLRESESLHYIYHKAHHIIIDGWGIIALSELSFNAYNNSSAPLPEFGSYVELLQKRQAYLQTPAYQKDRRYWNDALGEAPDSPFHDIGVKNANQGPGKTAAARLIIDREQFARFEAHSRALQQTPFVLIASALSIVLSRLYGVAEVWIGVTLLNRLNAEERNVVGQMVNILPLAVTVNVDDTPGAVIAQVGRKIFSAMRHQRFPAGDLQKELAESRRLKPGQPLFDLTISYHEFTFDPRRDLYDGDVKHGVVDVEDSSILRVAEQQEAISMAVRKFGDTLDVLIDLLYRIDRFDAHFTYDDFTAAFKATIDAMLAAESGAVGDFPIVSSSHLAKMAGFNRTTVVHSAVDTLSHAYEEQVRRTPSATALIAPTGEKTSYRDSFTRVAALAHRIRNAVGDAALKQAPVAILIPRSLEMWMAIMAVVRAGGAYLPVDPSYPLERVKLLFQDSGARLALLNGDARERFGDDLMAAGVEVLDVEPVLRDAEPMNDSSAELNDYSKATDLAYVIYTSGSTGRPKGVQIEHRAIVNRLAFMQRRYPIGSGDVLLLKTPTTFDVSVWELFWWSQQGAALSILRADAHVDPACILRQIQRDKVTAVHFVPSMLSAFLQRLEATPQEVHALRSVRWVFCSGEALLPGHVSRFNHLMSAIDVPPQLVNLYGPTEAAVDVSFFDCPIGNAEALDCVPIGKPVDNTQIYVLDQRGNSLPIGLPGELCIAGVQLARGYLNQQELTAAKFVEIAIDGQGQPQRLYRTGDRARWRSDGEIEYLGRFDDQIKLRGQRIELGEIQSHLMQHPKISDAVVVMQRLAGNDALCGYYVAREPVDTEEMRGFLSNRLPAVMVPTWLMALPALPLTINGKINRKALPTPSHESLRIYQAPRNAVERQLTELWSRLLGVEQIGVTDNYFSLGGNSILSLQLRAEAHRAGIAISLADLVKYPTIAELASLQSSRQSSSRSTVQAQVRYQSFSLLSDADRRLLAQDVEDAIPCTQLQLGMIYHSQAHPGSAMYRDVFQYWMRAEFSETAFRDALSALIAKHPALRSSFELSRASTPMQLFHRTIRLPAVVIDCRESTIEQWRRSAERHLQEAPEQLYQWHQPPLWSMTVHAQREHLALTFAFHHSILDGFSVASLVYELLSNYAQRLAGLPLDAVTLDTTVLAAAVRSQQQAVDSAETQLFWKSYLDGATPSQLSGWRAHESVAEQWGRNELLVRHIELPESLADKLEALSKLHRIPVKHLGFAVHCALLHLLGDAPAVMTGLVTHVRPEVDEAEQAIGMLLNTLPIRLTNFSGSWLELAKRCNAEEVEVYPHRFYPLARMQSTLGIQPLETAYNYVNFHHVGATPNDAAIRLTDFHMWEQTNFSILANLIRQPHDGVFRIRLDLDGQRYSPRQADLIAQYYRILFGQLADDCTARIDFDCLRQVANQPRSTVVSLFQLQSQATPRQPALVWNTETWTYGDLARTAAHICSILLAQGLQSGDAVALLTDRGPQHVACVLGVMQAGGACAPFDPQYPAARLRLMADLAKPKFAIGHERYRNHLSVDCSSSAKSDAPRFFSIDALLSQMLESASSSTVLLAGNAPAYILFTSGSTGTPKAVAMPHRALANLIQWQASVPSGQGAPTTVLFAPSSFDVSFQEIFSTLCFGGKLVIADEAARSDARVLLQLLIDTEAERIFLPYVALQQLAESAVSLQRYPSKLTKIISSGEQLRVTPEIRELARALPGCLLENQYGPTETHVATFHTMSGAPETWPKLPPLGQPIAGAEVVLCGESFQEAPIGVAGEIYIGGECVALGYFDNPDLTRERFIPHPFKDGERMYRTGDLARRLPDRTLVYMGRADRQVKIRGFRVEPAEVEAAILKTGLAIDAAVIARRDATGQNALFAYLIGRESIEVNQLRQVLRASLPSYLVPAYLEQLESLPKTPSGKRDDDALRRRSTPRQMTTASRAAETETEKRMLAIVRKVLNQSELAIDQDIFEAGGNSLHAVQIVVGIETQLQVQLPLSQLIATPTAAELARCVDQADRVARHRSLVALRRDKSQSEWRTNAPPIYFVHPIGGNVLCYMAMLPHLPKDRPAYALQAPGVFDDTPPCRSIPELAAHYIREIKRQQSTGPYVVGGWSFGGIVAFEMARQLKATGDGVLSLFMMDTIALNPAKGSRVTEDQLLTWFLLDLCYGAGNEADMQEPTLVGLPTEEKFKQLLAQAIARGALPQGCSIEVIRRLFRVFLAHWQAMLEYRPRPIAQDILLLRAKEPLPEGLSIPHAAVGSQHQDGSNGWSAHTLGKVRVVPVPGDHLRLMREPAIGSVVDALLAELDRL